MQEDLEMPIDLTMPKGKFRRRSSFFKLEAKSKERESPRENEMEKSKYIEKLESEQKDWVGMIRKYTLKARE